jgi:hypothetical protein
VSDAAITPTEPVAPSGERRQVTALFADMVGFTGISERLGEEGTFALIQPIYELTARAVREQSGSVKDFTGDGIMALFGVPDALEDGPLRACRAGRAIQECLAAAAPAIDAKHAVRHTLASIIFGVQRRVSTLAERIRQNPQFDPNGHHIGRCEMILGRLYRAKKKPAPALQHLAEAKRIASQFGPTPMLAKIEAALAELGGS